VINDDGFRFTDGLPHSPISPCCKLPVWDYPGNEIRGTLRVILYVFGPLENRTKET
jgi:hypothetical protein